MSNKNLTNPTTDEMCRIVYEAITGKCWHERGTVKRWGRKYTICIKCKHLIRSLSETGSRSGPWYDAVMEAKVHNYLSAEWKVIDRLPNPPLSESLDAWRPIWEAMTDKWENWEWFIYFEELRKAIFKDNLPPHTYGMSSISCHDNRIIKGLVTATAMHHLTAAYAVVKGEL